jgi:hypothetical protein
MQAAMIHVHIAGMVHIQNMGLMAGDALFNLFDQIETLEGIEAVIGQIQQFYALGSKDCAGLLGCSREAREFLPRLSPIAILLARSSSFRNNNHLNLISVIGMSGDGATTPENFVVGMSCNNKNTRHFR